ncbi:murein hydrolase activator EnvC family protein [Thermodesulfatator indicus]
MRNSFLWGLAALLALLVGQVTAVVPPEKIKEKSAILEELSVKEKKILKELEELSQKINKKQKEIDLLGDQIAERDLIIFNLSQKIKEREAKIKELEKLFRERLKVLATMGKVGWLNLLFAPSDISSFLRKQEYINLVLLHDKELASQLKEEKAKLEREKKIVLTEKARLEELRQRFQEEKQVLERLKQEKKALLEEVRRNKRLYAETLKMLKAAYAAIAQMAEELQKTRQELESTKTQIEEIKKEKSPEESLIPEIKKSPSLLEVKGLLPPPVPGTVIKTYGTEIDPITGEKKFNKGITIAAPAGTPVKTPYAGKILKISYIQGQGIVIFIDHGYYFLSVIGGLGNVSKSLGDMVSTGEVIGEVGEVPFGKPHVYYELRYKGKPLNPLDWLDINQLKFRP